MTSSTDISLQRSGRLLLQRSDWVKAGLIQLAKGGAESVGISSLAQKLKVTKGSFYWHFASRDELLAAVLEAWKTRATDRVIEIVETEEATAEAKIRKLAMLGVSSSLDDLGGSIELAIRNWARSHPDAKSAVAEIDKKRIDYLIGLFKEAVPGKDAKILACLHACFSVGLRESFAYTSEEKLAIRKTVLDTFFFPDQHQSP